MNSVPPISRTVLATALMALVGASSCADESVVAPELLPLEPTSVTVNETLRLDLVVTNPGGLAVDYSFSGPDLPGLDEVTTLAGSPSGGEFRWTPLASHVGTHEFIFTITSSQGDDSESAIITVRPAESAAPVFLRPGAGATYDLARDPCVRFDIEVRDDDSPTVDIRLRGTPLTGAQLVSQGAKQARFDWCPSQDQVEQSERWTIQLEADDSDHPPTEHDYLVVLRTQAREDCVGSPPTIAVSSPADGQRVSSSAGYAVVVSVSDDVGIRQAPLLYYTTVEPEDTGDPDVTTFDQTAFRADGANWRATVPALDLQSGQERGVYYVVSATDNDDATGTACDHRTDTPLRSFIATGSDQVELAPACQDCTASTQCQSGICATTGTGGRCLPACGNGCSAGTCLSLTTAEGATVSGCGTAGDVCDGGTPEECVDDSFEDNDTEATAAPLTSASIEATLCGIDDDFYAIEALQDGDLAITLDGFDSANVDFDLELLDELGGTLDRSAGFGPTETVGHCAQAGDIVLAWVYTVSEDDAGSYTLGVNQTAGDCCENDANEPDDTPELATPIGEDGNFLGTACSGDNDHYSFEIDGPTQFEVAILFDLGPVDLDLWLYGPGGGLVKSALTSTQGEETLTKALSEPGTYVLRVEAYEGSSEYLGQIMLTPIEACTDVDDCPIGTTCLDDACVVDTCSSDLDCPVGHLCPPAGTTAFPSHCAGPCSVNSDCRDEGIVEEACKRFGVGRGCGLTGSGQNGGSCDDFTDCGGQRACVAWPAGYCARMACTSNSNCEADTFCVDLGGLHACVRRCGGVNPACRVAEGYQCEALVDVDGTEEAGCVPL